MDNLMIYPLNLTSSLFDNNFLSAPKNAVPILKFLWLPAGSTIYSPACGESAIKIN